MKRFSGIFLTIAMLFSFSLSANAAVNDTGFSDVEQGAWYAEAVEYVQEHQMMSGTDETTFSPNSTMTRSMLATVLYRLAGSPSVFGQDSFADTSENAWYADAVLWALQQEVISGYGNGLFGAADPVSREQIATILWRYAGEPNADSGMDFSDEAAISSYAASAVDWARSSQIMSGMSGNLFSPKSNVTRAQVASILMNYTQNGQQAPAPDEAVNTADTEVNILVAYFTVPETSDVDAVASASRVVEDGEVVGNVELIARTIREETGSDLFAIKTVQTYPGTHEELLDFAADERNANARPALSGRIDNIEKYDVIFLGYPIWNADLPMPLYTFFDTYDFGGKTIIPFTAHGGSGFAGTIQTIMEEEPDANVERSGFSVSRNSVASAKDDIISWVREFGYTQAQTSVSAEPEPVEEADVLVAYFSQTGTTEKVAERIAEYTNGDLAEISRAVPYDDLQTEAQAEINDGVRPDITVDVDNMEEYEVIFIGYPIWWDEAPAMIAAFLAENDFGGKIVAPFCTSAYSPIDNSLHIFRELIPEAKLAEGLTANDMEDIRPWVEAVMDGLR